MIKVVNANSDPLSEDWLRLIEEDQTLPSPAEGLGHVSQVTLPLVT